jgi:hypothetical protein
MIVIPYLPGGFADAEPGQFPEPPSRKTYEGPGMGDSHEWVKNIFVSVTLPAGGRSQPTCAIAPARGE